MNKREHDRYIGYHCKTCSCPSGEEVREKMRQLGYTCIWGSEATFNRKAGLLSYNCKFCKEIEKY